MFIAAGWALSCGADGRFEATRPPRFKGGLRLLNFIGFWPVHTGGWSVGPCPRRTRGAPGALLLIRQYGIKRAHFKQRNTHMCRHMRPGAWLTFETPDWSRCSDALTVTAEH